MGLLLDTHTLIWFVEGSNRLSSKAQSELATVAKKYISVASLWEITIKSSKNKLELKQSLHELNRFLSLNNIQLIDIKVSHLSTLLELPYYHGDPFDRLLIAQAISENLTIISADQHFKAYPVKIIW